MTLKSLTPQQHMPQNIQESNRIFAGILDVFLPQNADK
jgi:hypothetical protein